MQGPRPHRNRAHAQLTFCRTQRDLRAAICLCGSWPAERFQLDLSKSGTRYLERIDHVKGIVDCFELVTHSFDVAIDCAVVNVNVIVIRSIAACPDLEHRSVRNTCRASAACRQARPTTRSRRRRRREQRRCKAAVRCPPQLPWRSPPPRRLRGSAGRTWCRAGYPP